MQGSLLLNAQDQLTTYDEFVNDPRGVVGTGYGEMDKLLRKGGLASSTLVLLVGKTRTRKTTLTSNLITNMLQNQVPVGLVGLDGNISNNYIGRLYSTWTGDTMEALEDGWGPDKREELREKFSRLSCNLAVYNGPLRPTMSDLSKWLLECEIPDNGAKRPEVVFIDYVSLLARNKYDGDEAQRIHRLVEELQVWTNEEEVVTVALHQVGRTSEGVAVRYHGDTPLTLEGMKYGGEEIADVVWCTYRPSLDPIANMTWDMAQRMKGDKFTMDDYDAHLAMAQKYRDYTFWQLVKNRPGVEVNEVGVPLRSIGQTMQMEVDTSILEEQVDKAEQLKAFGND